jgi:DNA-binding transcriptional LysR family regulator
MLAVPRRWGLGHRKSVKASSLSSRPFVTFPRSVYPAYYDRLIAASAAAGLTMNVVQEASTEVAILSLVSAGIGAAIVNGKNQARPPAMVQFIKLSDISIKLPLAFVTQVEPENPAVSQFITTLRQVMTSSTGPCAD